MDKLFQIGNFPFRVVGEDLPFPAHFSLFEGAEGEPEFTYTLRAGALPQLEGEVTARRPDLLALRTKTGEARLIGVKGMARPYGCYWETGAGQAEIWVNDLGRDLLDCDPAFAALFALERQMICRGGLTLHCAYLCHQGRAVLFSAPSETGKSTQAGLWERYRGSRTVNGDRALLQRVEGVWTARGWPVCGSSEICHREDTPIHAIVMLRQGKRNQVERLSPAQAFGQLYSQITVNQWNPAFVAAAMDGIEDLVGQVPVYQLTCDISEEAVAALEGEIFPSPV